MQELQTTEQVERYLRQARVISGHRELALYKTQYGWVCLERMTPEEQAQGPYSPQSLGRGRLIVNARTGVITVHSSGQHPHDLAMSYDEAIRTGQPIPGMQIYPLQERVTLRLTGENDREIVYSVIVESLTEPTKTASEHQLTIIKSTLQSRAKITQGPKALTRALTWARRQFRTTGTWPAHGTMEY